MTTEAESKIDKDLAQLELSENQLKLVKGIIRVVYFEGKIDGIKEFGAALEEFDKKNKRRDYSFITAKGGILEEQI